MCARGRLQGDRIHAGDFEQALLEQTHDFQAALREFLGLQWVLGGEAVEPGHEFVDAWVVLHRAGAQRVHAQVDRVVPGGKPGEVAQDFDLAYFREACNAVASMVVA